MPIEYFPSERLALMKGAPGSAVFKQQPGALSSIEAEVVDVCGNNWRFGMSVAETSALNKLYLQTVRALIGLNKKASRKICPACVRSAIQ
jgi:hypothetical protein